MGVTYILFVIQADILEFTSRNNAITHSLLDHVCVSNQLGKSFSMLLTSCWSCHKIAEAATEENAL